MDCGFHCLLCGDDATPRAIEKVVKGDPDGRLRVVGCTACGHVQLSPPSYDLSFYEADGQVGFVTGHYGTPVETLFAHSAIEAKRRIERFAEFGEELARRDGRKARLLDVGGGYGFFGSAITAARPDLDVLILEPSAARAETGCRHFRERADPAFPEPAFEIGLLDADFVAAHRGAFDVVTLWHVLEHVDDPVGLMKDAGELLDRNGTLWIEVPNLDDELMSLSPAYRSRSFMREHISYFTPSSLESMARKTFPNAEIEVRGYQRYGIFNYFHWIYHNAPQGAEPDLFERDRWWLETEWRTTRQAKRTTDALVLMVRMN